MQAPFEMVHFCLMRSCSACVPKGGGDTANLAGCSARSYLVAGVLSGASRSCTRRPGPLLQTGCSFLRIQCPGSFGNDQPAACTNLRPDLVLYLHASRHAGHISMQNVCMYSCMCRKVGCTVMMIKQAKNERTQQERIGELAPAGAQQRLNQHSVHSALQLLA